MRDTKYTTYPLYWRMMCVGRPIAFPSNEGKMHSGIQSSETPAALMERAAECLEIAQAQHEAADKQHHAADKQHHAADEQNLNADKLDELGLSLEASAVEIEGNSQMDAARRRL
jgi:hypothetical protein